MGHALRRFTVIAAITTGIVLSGAAPTSAASPATVRSAGVPTSANGASSMHLRSLASDPTPIASVVLEILEAPRVPQLYFWAMEVRFWDGQDVVGGAHIGLQWDPSRPGSTAVNFGGYDVNGVVLTGDASALAGTTSNQNTRNFAWVPNHRYRLSVVLDRPGWWRGEITDLETGVTTIVRRLRAGGSSLVGVSAWTEAFARCDAPRTAVRWSSFHPDPAGVLVTYQAHERGGCSNTTADRTQRGLVQRTNAERMLPAMAMLHRRDGWKTS